MIDKEKVIDLIKALKRSGLNRNEIEDYLWNNLNMNSVETKAILDEVLKKK